MEVTWVLYEFASRVLLFPSQLTCVQLTAIMDFELGGAFLTRSAENATKMFPFIKESLLHIYIEKTTLYSSVTCLQH